MSLLALQDLFRCHRQRLSGHWMLGHGARTIYFEAGDIVFATSSMPEDRLTTLLVERGKLTQVQLDYALANLKPGISIGRNLIDMGFITQRDLLEVAHVQVQRVVHAAVGTADELPTFVPQELDATTVRLPLETPQVLLTAMLELKDREGLLELLGPLNQVVVMEGRKHLALTLPPDLTKLPPLFDGTRTLLELGREVPVEPLRVGLFALFLREMGWARLHELPPLDQGALELALDPEPTFDSAVLPPPADPELPHLFAAIQAAERPTTNLDHLSTSFDELLATPPTPQAAPAPPYMPQALAAPPSSGFEVHVGEAHLTTPSIELPEIPEPKDDLPLELHPSTLGSAALPEAPPEGLEPKPSNLKGLLTLLLVVLLGAGGWFLWKHFSKPEVTEPLPKPVPQPKPIPQVTPPTVPTPAPHPQGAPEPAPQSPNQPKNEPPAEPISHPPAPKPASKPEANVASSSDSLEAIRKGDMKHAGHLGEKLVKDHPRQWAIRLEIASMPETVQKAPAFFSDKTPRLFILPFQLKDGRHAHQVFLGPFQDRATAEASLKHLPPAFRSGGNKPIIFQLTTIPRKQ